MSVLPSLAQRTPESGSPINARIRAARGGAVRELGAVANAGRISPNARKLVVPNGHMSPA